MNSHYIVLARKYRPLTINDLKGQEVLVTTLKNAFHNNRIAHAFLLSGIRGIGKTTTARILAKALNCIGKDGNGSVTLDPCNTCIHCTNIHQDSHLDVLEMDAASKTGIDDIREIIDNIKYKPLQARYKVYIIDEVHMLSKSAFNALLKTLEEPPPYIKFIFATTEIKKVPITIISRCQRFDLRRLNSLELKEHLANICHKENISFQENALLLIANYGEGSVRDCLSILDQAINISGGNITEDLVIKLLGKGNILDNYELFTSLTNKNYTKSFELFNKIYNNGIAITTIFEEMLVICHLVAMVKTSLDNEQNISNINSHNKYEFLQHLFLPEIVKQYTINLAQQLSLNELMLLWQILIKSLEEIKLSVLPKKSAEMALLRVTWFNEISTLPFLNKFLKSNIANINNNQPTTNTDNISVRSNYSTLQDEISKNNNQPEIQQNNTTNQNLEKYDKVLPIFPNNFQNQNSNNDTDKELTMKEILNYFPKAKIIKD